MSDESLSICAGNGEMNNPPEHTNIEELVGLSPRSDVSDDYLAGASPQMSEDEDAAEPEENPPDNMPDSSHPSFIVSCAPAATGQHAGPLAPPVLQVGHLMAGLTSHTPPSL